MRPVRPFFLALAVTLPAVALAAGDHGHGDAKTPYAGLQARAIKSLSEEDIAELKRGGGWGLALPAELNGKPGPAHLLELQEKIGLSPKQVAALSALHDEMRVAAIAAGDRLIAAEAALDQALQQPGLTDEGLRTLIDVAAAARADLRYVHLSVHLATPALLTEAQIASYNRLRGYADDPCDAVPEGHNPAMWRKHNGCE